MVLENLVRRFNPKTSYVLQICSGTPKTKRLQSPVYGKRLSRMCKVG